MAVARHRFLAGGAAAPVFAAVGENGLASVEALARRPGLRLVQSPRQAAILLVAGEPGRAVEEALQRIHDQLPPPRTTLWWGARPMFEGEAITSDTDPLPTLRALWLELLDGARRGEAALLPDEPPNPWRGLGDRGHGGEGMMGGTPYGRPMAMTAEDPRDGLALDPYTARYGPFLPMLPPGLQMEITTQGDMIVEARALHPPFGQEPAALTPSAHAARLLRLLGLPPLSIRGARWRGVFRAIPPGLGVDGHGDDVRARLRRWLSGEANAPGAPPLGEMLPGLEWQEAMLVLASHELDALRLAVLSVDAPGEAA
ncbi:MAG: hypothetical protein TEF_11715 [Rhizobiales bacterium NRL2]|nr:MAG: hypothetical protein TEF_11715 [Rhizobiales bacterium NRL2]